MKFIPSESVKNVRWLGKASALLSKSIEGYVEFYCIRDGDFEYDLDKKMALEQSNQKLFVLEKYSIENYIIDIELLYRYFLEEFKNYSPFSSLSDCNRKIVKLIENNKGYFVTEMLKYRINKHRHFPYNKNNISSYESIKSYINRANEIYAEEKLLNELEIQEKKFDTYIENGKWIEFLPGKNLLSLIINKFGKNKISNEKLKDFLIDEIKKSGIPEELKKIIDKINNSSIN